MIIVLASIPNSVGSVHNFEMPVKDNIEFRSEGKINIIRGDSFSSGIIRTYGGVLKLDICNRTNVNNSSYEILNNVTIQRLKLMDNSTEIVKSCNYSFTGQKSINIGSGYFRIIYLATVIINGNFIAGLVHGNNLLKVTPPENNTYYYYIILFSIPVVLFGLISYKQRR